jgi:spheroidene monooxygenase
MIATFHVVTYRRRRFPPSARPAEKGLRFWARFATAIDPFHAMPHPVSGARLLRPNLREWAYFAVWDDEADADRFLGDSPIAQDWRRRAAEIWSVWLKPVHARGRWAGVDALNGAQQNDLSPGPAATITRLELSPRAATAMWLSAAPRIAPDLPIVPGFVAGIPLMDRLFVQPMTFGLWRSLDDALAFAYAREGHRQAIGRMTEATADLVERFSSARFQPLRSEGSWKGRDPVRDAGAAA